MSADLDYVHAPAFGAKPEPPTWATEPDDLPHYRAAAEPEPVTPPPATAAAPEQPAFNL